MSEEKGTVMENQKGGGGVDERRKKELSQEDTREKLCSYCGATCDMDDNYCWKCGKRH